MSDGQRPDRITGIFRHPGPSVNSRTVKHQMTRRLPARLSLRRKRDKRAGVAPDPRTATRSTGKPSWWARWSASPAPWTYISPPAWNTRLWLSPSSRTGLFLHGLIVVPLSWLTTVIVNTSLSLAGDKETPRSPTISTCTVDKRYGVWLTARFRQSGLPMVRPISFAARRQA